MTDVVVQNPQLLVEAYRKGRKFDDLESLLRATGDHPKPHGAIIGFLPMYEEHLFLTMDADGNCTALYRGTPSNHRQIAYSSPLRNSQLLVALVNDFELDPCEFYVRTYEDSEHRCSLHPTGPRRCTRVPMRKGVAMQRDGGVFVQPGLPVAKRSLMFGEKYTQDACPVIRLTVF